MSGVVKSFPKIHFPSFDEVRKSVDPILGKAEKVANVVGYFPVLNIVVSKVRFVVGKLQLIAGVAAAAFYAISSLFAKGPDKCKNLQKADVCLDYSMHGMANMGRAIIESIPLLGLLITVPYDQLAQYRLKYDLENYKPCLPVAGPASARVAQA